LKATGIDKGKETALLVGVLHQRENLSHFVPLSTRVERGNQGGEVAMF